MRSVSIEKSGLPFWLMLLSFPALAHADTLLLRNKSLIEGDVRRTAKEYIVQNSQGGTIYVPNHKVLKHCKDRLQAYRWQLGRIGSRDVKQHVQLAQWCIQNGLMHEASDRLLYLNRFAANSRSVKLLEKELLAHSSRKKSKFKTVSLPIRRRQRSEKSEQVARALIDVGGLKTETVAQFRRVVQPLVLNRCGQAACHGSASTNDFQLVTIRGGSLSREHTIENLQRIARFVDLDEPNKSVLLDFASKPHGPRKSAPIHVKNIGKLKRIEDWVYVLAGKKRETHLQGEKPQMASASATDSKSPAAVSQENSAVTERVTEVASKLERFARKPDQRLLPPVGDEEKPTEVSSQSNANPNDPFDPNEFNEAFESGKE